MNKQLLTSWHSWPSLSHRAFSGSILSLWRAWGWRDFSWPHSSVQKIECLLMADMFWRRSTVICFDYMFDIVRLYIWNYLNMFESNWIYFKYPILYVWEGTQDPRKLDACILYKAGRNNTGQPPFFYAFLRNQYWVPLSMRTHPQYRHDTMQPIQWEVTLFLLDGNFWIILCRKNCWRWSANASFAFRHHWTEGLDSFEVNVTCEKYMVYVMFKSLYFIISTIRSEIFIDFHRYSSIGSELGQSRGCSTDAKHLLDLLGTQQIAGTM